MTVSTGMPGAVRDLAERVGLKAGEAVFRNGEDRGVDLPSDTVAANAPGAGAALGLELEVAGPDRVQVVLLCGLDAVERGDIADCAVVRFASAVTRFRIVVAPTLYCACVASSETCAAGCSGVPARARRGPRSGSPAPSAPAPRPGAACGSVRRWPDRAATRRPRRCSSLTRGRRSESDRLQPDGFIVRPKPSGRGTRRSERRVAARNVRLTPYWRAAGQHRKLRQLRVAQAVLGGVHRVFGREVIGTQDQRALQRDA